MNLQQFVLNIVLISSGKELLKQYGVLKYYKDHFPKMKETDIHETIRDFINDSSSFENRAVKKLQRIPYKYKVKIFEISVLIIKSCMRHAELPGEKNYVLYRLEEVRNRLLPH